MGIASPFAFSLRWFLVFVALTSVAMGGVIAVSEPCALLLSLCWYGLLPAAVVLAVYRATGERAFWVGVSVFAASLWIATFLEADHALGPMRARLSDFIAQRHGDRIEGDTRQKLDRVVRQLTGLKLATHMYVDAFARVQNELTRRALSAAENYLRILIALGGGVLGAYAYHSRRACEVEGQPQRQNR